MTKQEFISFLGDLSVIFDVFNTRSYPPNRIYHDLDIWDLPIMKDYFDTYLNDDEEQHLWGASIVYRVNQNQISVSHVDQHDIPKLARIYCPKIGNKKKKSFIESQKKESHPKLVKRISHEYRFIDIENTEEQITTAVPEEIPPLRLGRRDRINMFLETYQEELKNLQPFILKSLCKHLEIDHVPLLPKQL